MPKELRQAPRPHMARAAFDIGSVLGQRKFPRRLLPISFGQPAQHFFAINAFIANVRDHLKPVILAWRDASGEKLVTW